MHFASTFNATCKSAYRGSATTIKEMASSVLWQGGTGGPEGLRVGDDISYILVFMIFMTA